jgi:hypothetical protein
LVMVNDLSDVLLDSVCHYFIEDFCIDTHWGDWPIVLLCGGVLVWFWDECKTGFIKWVNCLVHSKHPALFAACPFQFLVYYSVLFLFFFCRAWGSICPGGYAGLSQRWLWE